MSAYMEISAEEMVRVQKVLQNVPNGARRAVANAIDRTVGKVATEFNRQMRQTYFVSKADMDAETKETVKKADSSLVGTIEYAGTKIPLFKFQVSPSTPNSRKPIRARVKRDSSGGTFVNAFIAQMSSGHVGMFQRVSEQRAPIEQKMGLAVAQMAGNEEVEARVQEVAQKTMDERLEHEIWRLLQGYGVKK